MGKNASVKKKRGIPKRSCSTTRDNAGSSSTNNYKFEEVDGMCLKQLQAAPSKQKEILNNMLLHMTEEEFNARNLTTSGHTMMSRNESFSQVQPNNVPNQEDESQGVFGFFNDT